MINNEKKLNLSNLNKLKESQICKIILEKILSQYPSPYIIKVLISSYYTHIDTTKKTIQENELTELLNIIAEKVGRLNIIKYLLDLEFYQNNGEKFSEMSTENTPLKNNKKTNSKLNSNEHSDYHFKLETDKFFKSEQNSFLNCNCKKEKDVFNNISDNKTIKRQIRQEEEINTDASEPKSSKKSKIQPELINLNNENNENNSNLISLTDSGSEEIIQIDSNDTSTKNRKFNKKLLGKKTRNNTFQQLKQEEKKRNILSEVKCPKKMKLGNHYSLDKGFFYKYFCETYKGNIAKFICADKMCKSIGKYNSKEKSFQIINNHTLLPEEHSYNKNKEIKDLKIIKFMKGENIEEMQFKK